MKVKFLGLLTVLFSVASFALVVPNIAAQAYGEGSYGDCTYNDCPEAAAPTTSTQPDGGGAATETATPPANNASDIQRPEGRPLALEHEERSWLVPIVIGVGVLSCILVLLALRFRHRNKAE